MWVTAHHEPRDLGPFPHQINPLLPSTAVNLEEESQPAHIPGLLGRSPVTTERACLARCPVIALAPRSPHPAKSPKRFRRQGMCPFRMQDVPGQQFRFPKDKG